MSKIELKRLVEFFWKIPSPDEKLPFAQATQTVSDNGTISKNLPLQKVDDNGVVLDKFQTEEENEKFSEMTLLRKLCFFLSLNIGIFYIVTLAWILPCRHEECSFETYEWKIDFPASVLTTNLATNDPNSLPHVYFGYASNISGHLACIEVSSGKQIWNRKTDFIPRHISCYSKETYENMPECFVASDDVIEAFNASSGQTIWQHQMKSSNAGVVIQILPSTTHVCKDSLLIIYSQFILVINSVTGHYLFEIPIPCSEPIDIKMSPWIKNTNDSIWYLMCDYGDSTEVWTFLESELLKFEDNTGENVKNFTDFHLLLSMDYYNGSMVLVSDVTVTSDILALSWADTVVMVTTQAPFHRPQKTWERSYMDPLGLPLPITSITIGHFTNFNDSELAVVLQQESHAEIHILNSTSGDNLTSVSLEKKQVVKMEKITGLKKYDSLLIETLPEEFSSHYTTNISDPEPLQLQRSYILIEFDSEKPVKRIIYSSDSVRGAVVYAFQNGNTDLLLAIESSNDFSVINKPIFRDSKTDGAFCNQIDQYKDSAAL